MARPFLALVECRKSGYGMLLTVYQTPTGYQIEGCGWSLQQCETSAWRRLPAAERREPSAPIRKEPHR